MPETEQKKITRKELLEIIAQAARDGREELDLSGRGITELPPEIGQLTNLKHLILTSNISSPFSFEFEKKHDRFSTEISKTKENLSYANNYTAN